MENLIPSAFPRLKAHLQTPLYRNGYKLIFNTISTSGLGILYWILATRFYPAEVVGINSALLSTLTLLSGMAELSLSGVLVRFLPVAGQHSAKLVRMTYGVSILAAILVALFFGLVLSPMSPTLHFISEQPMVLLAFVVSNVAWCLFTLQDSVLTGLRRTTVIVIENLIFSIGKIALLLLFTTTFQGYGLFASWTAPIVLAIVPVNLLIAYMFIPRHIAQSPPSDAVFDTKPMVRYVAGNYPGWLLFLASSTLLPLLIADQLGAKATAYFYLPWTIATSLYLIAVNMMTSLIVEASANQEKLALYCYRSLVQVLRLIIPIIVVILIGAPFVLRIFSREYADEGVGLIRVLAIAALPNTVVALYHTYARVRNHVVGILVTQAALCVLSLGLSWLLLHNLGIVGVGIAWLLSQTVVAVGILLHSLFGILRTGYVMAKQPITDLPS